MKKNMKKIEASSLCEASSCVTASYFGRGRNLPGAGRLVLVVEIKSNKKGEALHEIDGGIRELVNTDFLHL